MTCIVGFVNKGKVYIGGDSAGVSGLDYSIREDQKVFKKDNMIFGFTSSFRMGQILRYSFDIPEHSQKKDEFDYLCTVFIDALIKCFKEKGYARTKHEEVEGGTFLIGYKGKLYKIEEDFQVSQVQRLFDACGCGYAYALGAMKTMTRNSHIEPINPIEVITNALSVSEAFSAGVKAPFNVVEV